MNHDIKKRRMEFHDMIQIQVGRVLKLGEYQKKKSKQEEDCDNLYSLWASNELSLLGR